MSEKRDEMDIFWDVSKLVPKKKPTMARFSTSGRTTEFTVAGGDDVVKNKPKDERKINFDSFSVMPQSDEAESRRYIPQDSKLIKSVTVKPSRDRFDFYDTFRKAALIYYDYKCDRVDFAPFYSYKPQYSQMTNDQKHYYFYWRDEVRHGRYIKTDYSYVYLYAYEILNLPEKIGAEQGLPLLINVWRAYRKVLPRIDANFAQWVADYCLIYELPCPNTEVKDFLFDVINASTFKEFYLSDIESDGSGSSAMIAYLSDYDWRQGKYATGEHAEAYRENLHGAMQHVFASILSSDMLLHAEAVTVKRTAFPGSLCTHSVKADLEIEYYSVSDSPELRRRVTAAVKYTENKLRACLGVKSRLAVKELDDDIKCIIDKYFEAEFEWARKKKERENAPEYERLYDSAEERLSLSDALEIEKASWSVTARLVEGIAEYEEDEHEDPVSPTQQDRSPTADGGVDRYGLSGEDVALLRAIADSDNAYLLDAKKRGVLPESAVERINEAFADNFGDVIIEDDGMGNFTIIEDYYEEIIEWLQ